MRRAPALLGALLIACSFPAHATTPIKRLRYAPDVTTTLSGTVVTPAAPADDDLAGTVSNLSIGAIPAGARLTGYAVAIGKQLLSFDVTVPLNGATRPGDIVYNISYALYYSSLAHGVPDGVNLVDFALPPSQILYLVYDTTFSVAGIVVTPQDVLKWDGVNYSLAFSGAAEGLAPGVNLDAVEVLPNGHFLLSTDISGSTSGITFNDDDLLEFDPVGHTWQLAYSGATAQPSGWPPVDLTAMAACVAPAAATAGSNAASICQGGTLQLTATTSELDVAFSWTGPNGFTSTQQNPTRTNADPSTMNGTYSVVLSRNGWNGCASTMVSTSVTIASDPTPPTVTAPAMTTVTQTICN